MKRLFLTNIIFFALITTKSNAQVIPDDIVHRVNISEHIFEAEVIRIDAYWNSRHDYIYTSVTLNIKKNFKGNLSCGSVEMILLGGRVGDTELRLSHNLMLGRGQKGIFLAIETRRDKSGYDFYPETNTIVLEPTENEQGYIRYSLDDVNPDVIDYWQFQLPDLASAYNLMELYTQLQYTDCTPQPTPQVQAVDTILTVTLQNPHITTLNGNKAFEFDISLSDNVDYIYFLNNRLKVEYDTNVFVPFIGTSNKIDVSYSPTFAASGAYTNMILSSFSDSILSVGVSAKPPGSFGFNGYIDLPTTPLPAVHIIMEIKDCALADSLLPNNTAGVLHARYSLLSSSNSLFAKYDTEDVGNGVKFSVCGLKYISSISPLHVRGGVQDTVTFTGLGFGSTRGTSHIYLRNADNGGATFIHLDSVDYVPNGWNDTIIKFVVPSIVDSVGGNGFYNAPGTGDVKIKLSSGDSISDPIDRLYIDYSIINILETSGVKHIVNLTPVNASGNYGMFEFIPDTSFSNHPDRLTCLTAATKQWRCLTTVNFEVGLPDSSMSADSIETLNGVSHVIMGYIDTLTPSVIAHTQQWVYYAGGLCNQAYVKEIDLIVNKRLIHQFFTDTSRTADLPSGKIDLYRTLLHELGHGHSLNHVIDTNEIMFWGQPPGPIPAAYRCIQLMNCPQAVDGGNYIVTHSIFIDTAVCPTHRMSIGAINCTWIGITEIDENVRFSLYPNPTSDKLYINFDLEKAIKSLTVTISDLSGRNVYFDKLAYVNATEQYEMQLSELSLGYYVIVLNIDGKSYAGKIIKQ